VAMVPSGRVRYSLAVYVEQCLPVVCVKRRRLRAIQLRADPVDRGSTGRLYTAAPAVRVSCHTLYFVLTLRLQPIAWCDIHVMQV